MSEPEKIAIGVIWHSPTELVFQERIEETEEGQIKRYAFPGGRVEPGEEPLDATIREMKEEIGYEFIASAFIRFKVIKTAAQTGFFREAHLPYKTILKPAEDEKHKTLVLWTFNEINEALEQDTILPLTHAYIERHLT